MADAPFAGLRGKRLLVVEDEYIIARELADALERLGAEVMGPVGRWSSASRSATRSATPRPLRRRSGPGGFFSTT
jgi:hypothetical protein